MGWASLGAGKVESHGSPVPDAGSLALPAVAGLDRVSFQGGLGGGKTLKPGAYTVTIAARDTRGLRAVSPSLAFTIVG
jgi:hypothetical protein